MSQHHTAELENFAARFAPETTLDEMYTDDLIELERLLLRRLCRDGRGASAWRGVRALVEERLYEERRAGFCDF